MVTIAGRKRISGGNNLATGTVDVTKLPEIMNKIKLQNFLHKEQEDDSTNIVAEITREDYAHSYGPTVGDKVRLGDTSLYLEV